MKDTFFSAKFSGVLANHDKVYANVGYLDSAPGLVVRDFPGSWLCRNFLLSIW